MTNPMREVLVGLRSRFKHSFWGVNPRQRVSGERLGGKRCRPFHGLNGFCTFDLGLTPQAYAYTCFAVEKSHPLPLGVVRLLFQETDLPRARQFEGRHLAIVAHQHCVANQNWMVPGLAFDCLKASDFGELITRGFDQS